MKYQKREEKTKKKTKDACKLAYTSVEGDDLSAIGHDYKVIFFSILFFPSESILGALGDDRRRLRSEEEQEAKVRNKREKYPFRT